MTRQDFSGVFGHTPQYFRDQVNEALDRLEGEDDMKKRYKFSTMLLVAALIMSLVGGSVAIGTGIANDTVPVMTEPGVLPIVEETVPLEISITQSTLVLNYDDNYMTKLVEADTGIDIVWKLMPTAETATYVDLMFASGDPLSDILVYNMGDRTAGYAAEGFFTAIEEYYDQYSYFFWKAPGMTERDYEVYFKALTETDGHIYAYGAYEQSAGDTIRVNPYINRYWLKTLGLEMPTTKEELYDVLVAFRDQDPNGNGQKDEIPMIGHGWNGSDDEWLINMFLYWDPDYMLNVKDDVVYAPFATEDWQNAMIFMNKLVKEGLLSDLTFSITQDEMVSMLQSYDAKNQIVGVEVGSYATNFTDSTRDSLLAYDVIPPLEGQFTSNRTLAPGKTTFITTDCDIPEIAFRFLDYFAQEKVSLSLRYGEPGVHWMYRPDDPEAFDALFMPAQQTATLGIEVKHAKIPGAFDPWTNENNVYWNTWFGAMMPLATYSASGTPIADVADTWEESFEMGDYATHKSYMGGKHLLWRGNQPEQVFARPVYTLEELDEYNDTITQVKSYVNECIASFALGTLDPVADWETYLSNLESAGMNDWVELAQKYWDRSK